MRFSTRQIPGGVLLAILAVSQLSCGSMSVEGVFYQGQTPPDQPTLYIVGPNDAAVPAPADPNFIGRRDKLVVATHGWFEREPWPTQTAIAFAAKVDANEWLCASFDWRADARSVNPTDAARYARDTAAPLLAEKILRLSTNWKHIHLIGHSAGCWLITGAAKELADKTAADIHLTFLDAYVPPGWDEKHLGDIDAEAYTAYWADHYFTRDVTLKLTERWLTHAHNVDISDITPGLKDHEFPRYWYPATVLGRYAPKDRYDGKRLYLRIGELEYGFDRSREAGDANWTKSLSLPLANDAVKISKHQ